MISSLNRWLGYYDCREDVSRVRDDSSYSILGGCGSCYGCRRQMEDFYRDAVHMRTYFGPPPGPREPRGWFLAIFLFLFNCVSLVLLIPALCIFAVSIYQFFTQGPRVSIPPLQCNITFLPFPLC